MKSYRIQFWVIVVCTLIIAAIMNDVHHNGLGALRLMPILLVALILGGILAISVIIKGVSTEMKSEEIKNELEWRNSDQIILFVTIGLIPLNILIIYFLAR